MPDQPGLMDSVIPCSECQAGHLHREYIAYYTWLGDELITVPDFPAWVCDICGHCEYDENALTRLSPAAQPQCRQKSDCKPAGAQKDGS